MSHKVEITECYRDYTPPKWVYAATKRIIGGLPAEYLAGLRTVVLRNAVSLNHQLRRAKTLSRNKKVKLADCRGLYHRPWKNEPAWIELFTDNIVRSTGLSPWPAILQDSVLGDVLCHEIGHHVHRTRVPEHRDKEDVAEKWKDRLMGKYLRRRYWYLAPAIWFPRLYRPLLQRLVSKS